MAYDSHGGPGQYHSTSPEHGDGRPQVVLVQPASPQDCRDRPAQSGARMLTLPPLEQLGEWLCGRPWDAVIGRRLEVSCCPLSQWLLEALHAEVVLVDEAYVYVL